MKEYTSREAAIKVLKDHKICFEHDFGWNRTVLDALDTAIEALAADVVEVVRCGECTHWHRCLSNDGKIEYFNFSHCEKGHHGFPNFFCADGERRDGDGDA